MKRIFTAWILGLIFQGLSVYGQDVDTVKYTPDFKFEDGFYLNFSMVKNNAPLPLARVITNLDRSEPDFYNKLLQEKSFSYFDANGVKQVIPVSKIWGFSRNGVLYIKISEGFNRVTIIGNICHFVATITTYDSRYYDPYYNSPYYYGSRYYNPYYTTSPRQSRNQEVKQYLIDFQTGKIYEYEIKSVEILLMKDPELHDEFMGLRKRKKKQLKFYYIRKFNERNPIYLPVHNKF